MYNTFFGFREKPFKLVPNPDYLFLSKSHEVALAHLNYATEQGDGFVVITGEVGTGKTTLCRNYLEQLGDKTASAYIFNPQLDAVQLLSSICHEFGIETKDTPTTEDLIVKHLGVKEGSFVEIIQSPTTKDLLDKLNQYLMAQNRAGYKVVLLIDEAQALTVDNLEMVRMISNLETTRSKLIQIILVGQPELGDKLDTYELRQLAQRISLNCYLTPLSEKETLGYMHHRVNIAAQKESDIFSADAARQIHRYSAGIPRLINIACDRALLAAYSQNRQKVTGAMVKNVVAELTSHSRVEKKPRPFKPIWVWLPLAAAILVAALIVLFQMGLHKRVATSESVPADTIEPVTAESAEQSFKVPAYTQKVASKKIQPTPLVTEKVNSEPPAPEAPVVKHPPPATQPPSELSEALRALEPETSRINALTIMLERWGQPPPNPAVIPANINERQFFQIAARQYGLRAYVMTLDWPMIKRLNLPAVLVFTHPETQKSVYLAFVKWTNNRLLLADGGLDQNVETDIDTLMGFAQGTVYVYWKNTLGYDAIISDGAHNRAVMVVKTLLRQVGYDQLSDTTTFDRRTRLAIRDFQKQHAIKADGLVGPLTKILLIQQAKAFDLPALNPEREAGA